MIGDVTWSDGKARDLDEPQAGSITFRLRNDAGQWVPNSAGSLYVNSPFLLRRFRWSVNGSAAGVWYVVNWRLTNPAGTAYSEVEVTAVDGFELLSLDNLALLDPPAATTYEEVVMQDFPLAYYKLDDPVGSATMNATAGPEGVYGIGGAKSNVPTLGQPALIVGEQGTAADFGISQYGEAPVEREQFVNADGITCEVWVEQLNAGTDPTFLMGPVNAAANDFIFRLWFQGNSNFRFEVLLDGTVTPAITDFPTTLETGLQHLVGTWDGLNLRLYQNGVLIGQTAAVGDLETGDANGELRVGSNEVSGNANFRMAHAAFYEHVLSAERVAAHYAAGIQGFAEQTAGERIAAVADSDLWAETGIQTGEHMVHPVMEHGQSKLDEIRAAVKAEMPDTHFFFDGDGDPVYLGWDYKGGGTYSETQGTFGPADIAYSGIELVYDDEMFNEVTVGHESAPGEETQHTVTDVTRMA